MWGRAAVASPAPAPVPVRTPDMTTTRAQLDVAIEAWVGLDLSMVEIVSTTRYVPSVDVDRVSIILAADRHRQPPTDLSPTDERGFFPHGLARGGFDDVKVWIDGARCQPVARVLKQGERVLECFAPHRRGVPIVVDLSARLDVPRMRGPFGRHANQLTLAGGWYPYVAEMGRPALRGSHRVRVYFPEDRGVVIGRVYVPSKVASIAVRTAGGGRHRASRTSASCFEGFRAWDGAGVRTRASWPAPLDCPGWRSAVYTSGAGAGNIDGVDENMSRGVGDGVAQVGLVVLPFGVSAWALANGSMLLISRRVFAARTHPGPRERRLLAMRDALLDGSAFAAETLARGGRAPAFSSASPLLVVDAPLRHSLGIATEGALFVSDVAFELPPLERFLRFHRFALLREFFTALALRDPGVGDEWHVAADALGAWLRDRYVRARFGAAEDAFDVLSLWSWIPAVDSLLYAPQVAFVGAYFRMVNEEDPLRPNFVDFPSTEPRGKLIYEKLLDRVGPERTARAMDALVHGRALLDVLRDTLGADAMGFWKTWSGPYPSVRYTLVDWRSRPARCQAGPCFAAEVVVSREGDAVAEPVMVRLRDERGRERIVTAAATLDDVRTVTATLSAPLAKVWLDPYGRLAETPTSADPSPLLDNQSSSDWRVILNNFNLLIAASEGQVDTSLDVGFSRVRDVHLSHAVRASVSPEAFSLSGRTSYAFGRAISPDKLVEWIGAAVAGEFLRPEFAGTDAGAFSAAGLLYYGYDDRRTVWAPEAGTAFRLSTEYSHVFGAIPAVDADRDALSVALRALRSWRFDARHQLSIRGAAGVFLAGRPLPQLLYPLGGRAAVRGYAANDEVGRVRGLLSGEWVHALLANEHVNAFEIGWATGLDGALFFDVAAIGDRVEKLDRRAVRADVGYGLRVYLDYFGVRPGVIALDVAFPLVDPRTGRWRLGSPAVYLDFAQSFLVF